MVVKYGCFPLWLKTGSLVGEFFPAIYSRLQPRLVLPRVAVVSKAWEFSELTGAAEAVTNFGDHLGIPQDEINSIGTLILNRFASPFEDNYCAFSMGSLLNLAIVQLLCLPLCGSFKWTTTIWPTLVLVTALFVGSIKLTRSQKSTKSNKESQPKSSQHPALWKAFQSLTHLPFQTAANLIKLKCLRQKSPDSKDGSTGS